MALSEGQIVQIRKWLGYSDLYRDDYSWLNSVFATVGARPDTQTEVEAILAKLATVDAFLDASMTTGGLKRAEDIEWYEPGSEFASKAKVGRMYCQRLATILNVPLGADAFGGGSMSGLFGAG